MRLLRLAGKLFIAVVLSTLFVNLPLLAQAQMQVPQLSPKAAVSQTIGITDVTISYHRPSVNNRKVWGGLVPHGQVWRAGANENSTISFSDPVKIEGKDLPAGTYGLHTIPGEETWTIIFSKNSTSWGSFTYDEHEDALRVTVKPQPAEMQEMLRYDFESVTNSSAVVALRWEKLMVPVKIDVDTKEIVIARAKEVHLRGLAQFTWQGFYQAAAYCVQANTHLDEALTWIDKSIALNENANNLYLKGGLLEKLGKSTEADAVRKRMTSIAKTEVEVNLLGYLYLNGGKKKEAIEIFKKNVKSFPDSWNVYDSLGEGYAANGDNKLAIESYSKALNLVKDTPNKQRISDTIQKLQGGGI